MNSWVGYELTHLRGQDLAHEAEVDRLARAAMRGRQRNHPIRRTLGKGLVRAGLLVAGVCNAEALERRGRPQAAG